MLDPQEFITSLDDHGISFYAGVPCSFLKEPMSILAGRSTYAANDAATYVGAAIETDAAALCAGAWLAGKRTAVLCQNSGLGNLISPLSSLNAPFEIPTLLVMGWRGKPGNEDEPQHRLMGSVTLQMLAQMGVEAFELPTTDAAAQQTVNQAMKVINTKKKSAALLVGPKTFASGPAAHVEGAFGKKSRENQENSQGNSEKSRENQENSRENNEKTPDIDEKIARNLKNTHQTPTRYDLLTAISKTIPSDVAIIATTGKCGRELCAIEDKKQNFYMVGSMGSASAIGLGAALNTKRRVLVLDGDGAALMRLGTMATIGRVHPSNLVHVILDNQAHDSTGGQPTGSENIDFAAVAAACGYASATSCDDTQTAIRQIDRCLASAGPHLVHIHIKPGSRSNLGRPTVAPAAVAQRFRIFLAAPLSP